MSILSLADVGFLGALGAATKSSRKAPAKAKKAATPAKASAAKAAGKSSAVPLQTRFENAVKGMYESDALDNDDLREIIRAAAAKVGANLTLKVGGPNEGEFITTTVTIDPELTQFSVGWAKDTLRAKGEPLPESPVVRSTVSPNDGTVVQTSDGTTRTLEVQASAPAAPSADIMLPASRGGMSLLTKGLIGGSAVLLAIGAVMFIRSRKNAAAALPAQVQGWFLDSGKKSRRKRRR